MIEAFIYWFMQKLGYRKYYYDWAFAHDIRLTSYETWLWRPKQSPGTMRENRDRLWEYCGYGVDC